MLGLVGIVFALNFVGPSREHCIVHRNILRDGGNIEQGIVLNALTNRFAIIGF